MAMLVLLILELAAAGAVLYLAKPRYALWMNEQKGQMKASAVLFWAIPAGLWFMDRFKLADRLSPFVGKIHHMMVGLHGAKSALAYTKWFMAKSIASMYGIICLMTLLGWASGGQWEMLAYGLAGAVILPMVFYKQSADQLKRKKQLMLIELPEVLNQLMLLVGAGETVTQAIARTVEGKDSSGNPLLLELSVAAAAIKMNASFSKVMEDFSKRCALQEVSLFTTTLLLNYKRGGDELAMSLKELSLTLWDKRKALARTLGEEAASKMVFPMVLIFFVVMVIVAAPALMMMS